MKRAVAIVLSLLLIWIQAVVAVQTSPATGDAKNSCCAVKSGRCCCVSESTSTPQPLPAATVPAVAQSDFTATVSLFVAWTLPEFSSSQISSSDSAPSLALAVPLFQRNCALLI